MKRKPFLLFLLMASLYTGLAQHAWGNIGFPEDGSLYDTGGIYVVKARNADYCNEALMTVNVKDNPPAPTYITGPDTICPLFTAEYSAVPTSSDYYILWEWTVNGTTYTQTGNTANITFGYQVSDINVYQVDRRTDCRSDATIYHVSAFQLAEWPYQNLIRVCQGQTLTLSLLRDQSDYDVLYEWEVDPNSTYALSVQGSHLNADVTLLANYTNDLPQTVPLILKRTYCGTYRYDVAYVRIGEIDPPSFTHDPICMGQPAGFEVEDINDANTNASYWYVDEDTVNKVYGIPASLVFRDRNMHEVHLHYVSRFGCETETTERIAVCDSFPDMRVVADSVNGTLSINISGGNEGYAFLWMTGDTTPIIEASSDDYWCNVTRLDCGCVMRLSHSHSSPGCIGMDSVFGIVNHCYNIISIQNLNRGLRNPFEITIAQGNHRYHHVITSDNQRIRVPDTGAYTITAQWDGDDACYYCTVRDTIRQAIKIQLQNDCQGHLVMTAEDEDGTSVPFVVEIHSANGASVTERGRGRIDVPIHEAGRYSVRVVFDDNVYCYFDTMIHFDAPPVIRSIDVRREMCKQTPFTFFADVEGEDLTYQWDFGDGSSNFGNGIDHVYENPRYPTITLSVTDHNNCNSTFSQQVNIRDNFLNQYSLNQIHEPICQGDSAVIQTNNGNNLYSWYPCTQFTEPMAYVYAAGTYIVDITSVQEGCRKQLSINVRYPNGPIANIRCNSTYCMRDIAHLVGDAGMDYSYQWYVNTASSSHSSTSSNFDYQINDTGTHQVILTISDENGCTSSDTAFFYVQPSPPAPSIRFCGNHCITEGPVVLCSPIGQELLWSNGTKGPSAQFFTDGWAGAYYYDGTGCKSELATIHIPEAPDFAGLLTGCYCIKESDLPQMLPLYTLSAPNTLPWTWFNYHSPIFSGTLPPSPSMLDIPSAGKYQLEVHDYGMGCRARSPQLIVETDGCRSDIGPGNQSAVVGIVKKKMCEQVGCDIWYRITVSICNYTDQPVCIDNIVPAYPLVYSIVSGLPLSLNPDECQDVTFMMQYNISALSSFGFEMTCGGSLAGRFVVDLSDWMDCVQPDTCTITATPSLVLDQTLSLINQTAFFHLGLTCPTITGNIVSVSCNQGQIIDGTYSGNTFGGLMMMDYGLMTQMVVSQADLCFRIVCCNNGNICVSTVCVSFRTLWELCQQLTNSSQSKGGNDTGDRPLGEDDKAFRLVPNPATNRVRVVNQKETDAKDEIRTIEVFSMNGQKVLSMENTTYFDVSRLAGGSYIVKVVSATNHAEYLRLVKH